MNYSSRYLTQLKHYSDLTEQFPMQLDRGNNYILMAYHYDNNDFLTTPRNNITGPCIPNGITKIHDKLRKQGLTTKLYIMDNEVSEDIKKYFEYSDIQFQLLPPHIHWKNAAERAVRTFKNHFIAALCTVGPLFTFYLWYRLLPQVTMTLHMLRLSQLNPELSAYEQVDGIHNFEQTPLAPLGCKVQIHKKSHKRLTYAPHSVDGWYLVPEVHHYRFYILYNIYTGVETIPDIIDFSRNL